MSTHDLDDYCYPEDYDLRIGSCEGCGSDVYEWPEKIGGDLLCDRCAWERASARREGGA